MPNQAKAKPTTTKPKQKKVTKVKRPPQTEWLTWWLENQEHKTFKDFYTAASEWLKKKNYTKLSEASLRMKCTRTNTELTKQGLKQLAVPSNVNPSNKSIKQTLSENEELLKKLKENAHGIEVIHE